MTRGTHDTQDDVAEVLGYFGDADKINLLNRQVDYEKILRVETLGFVVWSELDVMSRFSELRLTTAGRTALGRKLPTSFWKKALDILGWPPAA